MRKFTLLLTMVFVASIGIAQTANYIPKFTNSGTDNSAIYQSNTNIGIGMTNPSQKLSVTGNVHFTGNLGLGTITPLAKLHIEGSIFMPIGNGVNIGSQSESGTRLRLFHDSYWAVISFNDMLYMKGPRTVFGGEHCAGSPITIHKSGSVASADADNLAALTIWGGWETDKTKLTIGIDNNSKCSYIQSSQNYIGFSALVLNNKGGNVGIGVANPAAKLHVVGNSVFTANTNSITSAALIRGLNGYSSQTTPDYTWYNNDQTGIFHPAANVIGFTTGGTERMRITSVGVGIGTSNLGNYKLAVNGDVRAKSVTIDTCWYDFVFEEDYKLMSLSEVENFIKRNKHLPEIPSAKEVETNGVNLGDMQGKVLMKVEELTLYMIQLQKTNDELQKQIELLKLEINNLQTQK